MADRGAGLPEIIGPNDDGMTLRVPRPGGTQRRELNDDHFGCKLFGFLALSFGGRAHFGGLGRRFGLLSGPAADRFRTATGIGIVPAGGKLPLE